MTLIRPPFPEFIDSTMIASFRSCPRKFYLEFLEHYKPRLPSVHLHAGAAFAKGLEIAREAFYIDHLPHEACVQAGVQALMESYGDFECPEDSPKSCSRMAGALVFYFDQYHMENDKAIPVTMPGGAKGIEFSFAEPIDLVHPETGNPLLYVGRMDMLAQYAGALYGEDDKTTSQLGASWSKQWDLRSQFTGYCWGAGRAGFPLQGFLVRGVSILKTKYDTQQAITYRPQWMIDRWYDQLMLDVNRLIVAWQGGYYDYNLDHACNEYGGCLFRRVCLSENPGPWLEQDYERRVWNPVERSEKKL